MDLKTHVRALSAEHQRLHAALRDHLDEVVRRGGGYTPQDRTKTEALNKEIEAVEGEIARFVDQDEREERDARFREANAAIFGGKKAATSGSNVVGTALRAGVEDVLSGKLAVARVPLEPVNTLTEAGDFGHGVPIEVGATKHTLRGRSVVMSIPGVNIVPMSSDKLVYPRLGEDEADGVVEAEPFDTDDPDLDLIVLNAVKFGKLVQISTEAEEDFNENALQLLADNLLKALALKVDAQLLEGTGAGPGLVGIRSWPGINTTSVGAVPSNFAKLREVEYELAAADADVENAVWLLHPRSWWTLSSIKTGLSSDETTLLEPNPQEGPRKLLGHPVKSSTQITTTEGAGAGSWVGLVDGSQLVVGERTAPQVEISRDFAFDKDLITLRARCRYGFAIVNPGAVSIATDVRAS
jgi:HK97 family phage major capsid protein